MMTTNDADVLSRHGILRATQVVQVAAAAGLSAATAAVLLVKESGRTEPDGRRTYGHNLWGHDQVPTGGIYVPGAEVSRQEYVRYRDWRRAGQQSGQARSQGVGPCQLTHWKFQDDADQRGGCWDPAVNMRVGFETLAGHIRRHGEQQGFRRYNGSGDRAETYGREAVALLAQWRAWLAAGVDGMNESSVHVASGRAELRMGDTGDRVAALQVWFNTMFPSYSGIDLKPKRYGPQTTGVVAEFKRRVGMGDTNGEIVDTETWKAIETLGYKGGA